MTDEEELFELQNMYDDYLARTEGRGISWGEIHYIQGLNKKERQDLFDELEKERSKNEKRNRK